MRLRGLGIGAFVAYLSVPQVVLFILVGLAVSWWVSAVIFGGSLVVLVLALFVKRWNLLAGAFGTGDRVITDTSLWTRDLVIQPLVQGLWIGIPGSVALIVADEAGASEAMSIAAAVTAGVIGWVIGAWRWQRAEVARRRDPT